MTNINKIRDYALMDGLSLFTILVNEFDYQTPGVLNTSDDLSVAAKILSDITNTMSFLTDLESYINIEKRKYKRRLDGEKKGSERYQELKYIYEDFTCKENIVKNKLDSLDDIKQTTSRLITVKQEINKELMMTGDTP